MINKHSILNGAKHTSDGLQNYLVFVSARHIDYISNHCDKIDCGVLQKYYKKLLKIPILQTLLLL